jgi:hypothetical protein
VAAGEVARLWFAIQRSVEAINAAHASARCGEAA